MDSIKPIRKVKSVHQSGIQSEDDLFARPSVKNSPTEIETQPLEFFKDKILLHGKDIGESILEMARIHPSALANLAADLEGFKEFCLKRRKKKFALSRKKNRFYDDEELSLIFALCDIYIAKIGEHIKKRFDETKDGLALLFDEDGQLVLNGMNIHTFVERCRENRSEKSLLFLKGVRRRLELVLENKASSRNYERIEGVVLKLFAEIDEIFKMNK